MLMHLPKAHALVLCLCVVASVFAQQCADEDRDCNGVCFGGAQPACGCACVDAADLPTPDLCTTEAEPDYVSGGCSGIPVNACVQCNPDGSDPSDVASATQRGYYPCCWDENGPIEDCDPVGTDGCQCKVVLPLTRDCNMAVGSFPYASFDENTETSQLFYTGNGFAVSNDPADNAGGCYSGFPNVLDAYGMSVRIGEEQQTQAGVDTRIGTALVRSFAFGVNATVLDPENNFVLRFALKPGRETTSASPAFDEDAYFIHETNVSGVFNNLDADSYYHITPPSPVEVRVGSGAGGDLYVTMETDAYSFSGLGGSQIWLRSTEDTNRPQFAFRLPAGGVAGVEGWFVLIDVETFSLDVQIEFSDCETEIPCEIEQVGCDVQCFSEFREINGCDLCRRPGDTAECSECPVQTSTGFVAGYCANDDLCLQDGRCECEPDPCYLPDAHYLQEGVKCLKTIPFNKRVYQEAVRALIAVFEHGLAFTAAQFANNPDYPFNGGQPLDLVRAFEDILDDEFETHIEGMQNIGRTYHLLQDCHHFFVYNPGLGASYSAPVRFFSRDNRNEQYLVLGPDDPDGTSEAFYNSFFAAENGVAEGTLQVSNYYGWKVVGVDGESDVDAWTQEFVSRHNNELRDSRGIVSAVTNSPAVASPFFVKFTGHHATDVLERSDVVILDLCPDDGGECVYGVRFPLIGFLSTGKPTHGRIEENSLFGVLRSTYTNFTQNTIADQGAVLDMLTDLGVNGWYSAYAGEGAKRSMASVAPEHSFLKNVGSHVLSQPHSNRDEELRNIHSSHLPEALRLIHIDNDMLQSKLGMHTHIDESMVMNDEVDLSKMHKHAMDSVNRQENPWVVMASVDSKNVLYRNDKTKTLYYHTTAMNAAIGTDPAVNVNNAAFINATVDAWNTYDNYKFVIDLSINFGGLPYVPIQIMRLIDTSGQRFDQYIPGYNDGFGQSGYPNAGVYGLVDFGNYQFNFDALRLFFAMELNVTDPFPLQNNFSSTTNGSVPYFFNGDPSNDLYYADLDIYGNSSTVRAQTNEFTVFGDQPLRESTRTFKRGEVYVVGSSESYSAASNAMIFASYLNKTIITVHVDSSRSFSELPLVSTQCGSSFSGIFRYQDTRSTLTVLSRIGAQAGIPLENPERYDVYYFMFGDIFVTPSSAAMNQVDGKLRSVANRERAQAQCAIYGNVREFSGDDFTEFDNILRELREPDIANECGCADEFRGCDGVCFSGYRTVEQCNGACVAPTDQPQPDLCTSDDPANPLFGYVSGGCSGIPVNNCVQCNPDEGEDPADVANASEFGYYPCGLEAGLVGNCTCVSVPPDVIDCGLLVCEDPQAATASIWVDSERDSYDDSPFSWTPAFTIVRDQDVAAGGGGCVMGARNIDGGFGVAQRIPPNRMPAVGQIITGVEVGFELLVFNPDASVTAYDPDMPIMLEVRPPRPATNGLYDIPNDAVEPIFQKSVRISDIVTAPAGSFDRKWLEFDDGEGYFTVTEEMAIEGIFVSMSIPVYDQPGGPFWADAPWSPDQTQFCVRTATDVTGDPSNALYRTRWYNEARQGDDWFSMIQLVYQGDDNAVDLDIALTIGADCGRDLASTALPVWPLDGIDAPSGNRFYTGQGTERSSNRADNFGGHTWGVPNGRFTRGVSFGLDAVALAATNVSTDGDFLFISSVAWGVEYFNYNPDDIDFEMSISLRPTLNVPNSNEQRVPNPAARELAYGEVLQRMSEVVLTADNKWRVDFPEPVIVPTPVEGDPRSAIQLVYETTDDFPLFVSVQEFPEDRTQVWFRVADEDSSNMFQPAQYAVNFDGVPEQQWFDLLFLEPNFQHSVPDIAVEFTDCTSITTCGFSDRGCDGRCFSVTDVACNGCRPPAAQGAVDFCDTCSGGDTAVPVNECVPCCAEPAGADPQEAGACQLPGLHEVEGDVESACVADPCYLPGMHYIEDGIACLRSIPFNRRVYQESVRSMIAQFEYGQGRAALLFANNNDYPFNDGQSLDIVREFESILNDTFDSHVDGLQNIGRTYMLYQDCHHRMFFTLGMGATYSAPVRLFLRDDRGEAPRQRLVLGPDSPAGASEPAYNEFFAADNGQPGLQVSDYFGWHVEEIDGRTDLQQFFEELAERRNTELRGSPSTISAVTQTPSGVSPFFINFRFQSDTDILNTQNHVRMTLCHNNGSVCHDDVLFPLVGFLSVEPQSRKSVDSATVASFYRDLAPPEFRLESVADQGALFEYWDTLGARGLYSLRQATGGARRRDARIAGTVRKGLRPPVQDMDVVSANVLSPYLPEVLRLMHLDPAALATMLGMDTDDIVDESMLFGEKAIDIGAMMAKHQQRTVRNASGKHQRQSSGPGSSCEIIGTIDLTTFYRCSDTKTLYLKSNSFFGSPVLNDYCGVCENNPTLPECDDVDVAAECQVNAQRAAFVNSVVEAFNEYDDHMVVLDISENGGGFPFILTSLLRIIDSGGQRFSSYVPDYNDGQGAGSYPQAGIVYPVGEYGSSYLLEVIRALLRGETFGVNANGTDVLLLGEDPARDEYHIDISPFNNGTSARFFGDLWFDFGSYPVEPLQREFKRGDVYLLTSAFTFSGGSNTHHFASLMNDTVITVHLDAWRDDPRPILTSQCGSSSTGALQPNSNDIGNLVVLLQNGADLDIELDDAQRHDVYPFAFTDFYVTPTLVYLNQVDNQLKSLATTDRMDADCAIYGNVREFSRDPLAEIDNIVRELRTPDIVQACGCADEYRDCQGTCFGSATRCDIVSDCDPVDDTQCQVEDACGTCGAVIAEGWPPGEGVSFVVEEWEE